MYKIDIDLNCAYRSYDIKFCMKKITSCAYLRQKFYNLNCILMMTCIFVETSIPMFPTL